MFRSSLMPQYQLEVAIALVVSATCSLSVYLLLRPTEGKIYLPYEVEEEVERDPFDVTKPEDFVDGTPVNAEAFWQTVRYG